MPAQVTRIFKRNSPPPALISGSVSSTNSNPRLGRFAWFTAIATLFLICSGGMVTSKGVGLAVPDWPTTFGYNMFLFPVSKWVGGVLFEHTHRLIASLVGCLTIVLAVWLWRAHPLRWVRVLGWCALGAVILQGILGGWRVTMLKDEIGIFHACLAQAFFGLLIVIALTTTSRWFSLGQPPGFANIKRLTGIAVATCLAIYVQLGLGATIRHQHRDLALVDFPTANGRWLPDTSPEAMAKFNSWRDTQGLSDVSPFQIWLQMAHRFGALAIAGGALAVWSLVRKNRHPVPLLRSLSTLLICLVMIQIGLGAWTIWSNKAADIATAHVAVGASIFGLTVAISAICCRLRSATALSSLSRPVPAYVAVSS